LHPVSAVRLRSYVPLSGMSGPSALNHARFAPGAFGSAVACRTLAGLARTQASRKIIDPLHGPRMSASVSTGIFGNEVRDSKPGTGTGRCGRSEPVRSATAVVQAPARRPLAVIAHGRKKGARRPRGNFWRSSGIGAPRAQRPHQFARAIALRARPCRCP